MFHSDLSCPNLVQNFDIKFTKGIYYFIMVRLHFKIIMVILIEISLTFKSMDGVQSAPVNDKTSSKSQTVKWLTLTPI